MSGRWKTISPSQFPWEQDALDFVQRALPNREPFRAYSNFEFVEVIDGLQPGDKVIISDMTNYKNKKKLKFKN